MKKNVYLMGILSGLIAGFIGAYLFTLMPVSQNQIIADHYASETAVLVSPHSLRKHMAEGDQSTILVDLRSQEEYEREHIIGAVSIPAYKDPDTSAYGDVERIVNSFSELITANPGKEIIAYCYSMPCMTSRKIGKMLADHDIYIKELGIGWNEWRYHWNLWNHEHEWDKTDVQDYVHSGAEPGVFKLEHDITKPCPIDNEFGC